jgi:hypothetical protein
MERIDDLRMLSGRILESVGSRAPPDAACGPMGRMPLEGRIGRVSRISPEGQVNECFRKRCDSAFGAPPPSHSDQSKIPVET